MAEFFDQTPLTEQERAIAREGFKHCYQDFWRNLASGVGATSVQLGLLSEIVGDHVEQLRQTKALFFEQAITTDGPFWRSRRYKVYSNMEEVALFGIHLRENHPGISEYEVVDSSMDLIIMRKPERTEQMGQDLARVLISDPRVLEHTDMEHIITAAAYSLYNRENVAQVHNHPRT